MLMEFADDSLTFGAAFPSGKDENTAFTAL